MQNNTPIEKPTNKRLFTILFVVAITVLIPLVAMQFTSQVRWSLFDFIVAAVVLLSAGLLVEIILRSATSPLRRAILCLILFVALVLLWMELAVGIFGSPFSGN